MKCISTTKDKRDAWTRVGEAKTQPYLGPHPGHGDPTIRKYPPIQNSLLRSEGIVPHVRHPNPGGYHWKDELLQCPVLKINGDSDQENLNCREQRFHS